MRAFALSSEAGQRAPSGASRARALLCRDTALLRPPDALALELGRDGEVLAARLRLWAVGIAALLPLENLARRAPGGEA